MSRYRIELVVFLAGLAAVCWIGAGYASSNPLALIVTLLIALCYVAGAVELYRYQQGTVSLAQAVSGLSAPPASLDAWLEPVHPSLRGAVRLRVEGERAGLPGPALTPYLVGLLVLLGMLGTLLGMVSTLRGTGAALDSATDLAAVHASLAAPIKGLGFAFGTSIAGVATSAMLGLLSALSRRERMDAARRLDERIATTLRQFSHAWRREESFRLMQRQADALPALVERIGTMMTAMEQRSVALDSKQLDAQQALHESVERAYTTLASSVGRALKDSAADSARGASAAIQPVVQATMTGLSREMTALGATVTQAVQQQLDGLSSGFETSTANVAELWTKALAQHERSGEAQAEHLRVALQRFTETFGERSASLLDEVAKRLDTGSQRAVDAWQAAFAQQQGASENAFVQQQSAIETAFAQQQGASEKAFAEQQSATEQAFAQRQSAIEKALAEQYSASEAAFAQRQSASEAAFMQRHSASEAAFAQRQNASEASFAQQQSAIEKAIAQQQSASESAFAQQHNASETLATQHQQALTAATTTFEQHATALLRTLDQSHADLQQQLAARDTARLGEWTSALDALAASLGTQWREAGEQTVSRQQAICDTLERTARDITAQTEAHANSTIAEIARLVRAASEAPKAAAEVVAELRQKLSDSMVRDTAMLDERARLLETLGTLLDAVNHTSTQQRTAVDALVTGSSDLLERVGTQFSAAVDNETRKLGGVAAQVTGSAVEVASLGDAFGSAVQVFGDANERLVAHLQRIEQALDRSLARSDEQLAYYVAQAREVIDLSMLSQKQIVEDLQQLAAQRTSSGAEAV